MTSKRTRFVLIPAALALMAVGAACGGGDDDDDDTGGTETPGGTASATTAAGGTATATSAGGGATSTATAGGSGGGLFDRLDDDDEGDQEPEKSVFEMSGGGFEGTITIANMPPNSLFAMEGTSDGESFNMTIIVKDQLSYFCTEEAGTGTCIESGVGDNPLTAGFQDLIDYDAEDELRDLAEEAGSDIREIDGRTIAGRDAECYEFSGPDGDGIACIDEETGRLLFMEGDETETGAFRYELVEFGQEPSEEDFEPPFPVTSIGG